MGRVLRLLPPPPRRRLRLLFSLLLRPLSSWRTGGRTRTFAGCSSMFILSSPSLAQTSESGINTNHRSRYSLFGRYTFSKWEQDGQFSAPPFCPMQWVGYLIKDSSKPTRDIKGHYELTPPMSLAHARGKHLGILIPDPPSTKMPALASVAT